MAHQWAGTVKLVHDALLYLFRLWHSCLRQMCPAYVRTISEFSSISSSTDKKYEHCWSPFFLLT